jgi:hypothetical protein
MSTGKTCAYSLAIYLAVVMVKNESVIPPERRHRRRQVCRPSPDPVQLVQIKDFVLDLAHKSGASIPMLLLDLHSVNSS